MRVATFITARLKSTRLPRKVLKPILGEPMLVHMIRRLRLAKRPERIVLCTSTIAEDDPLEAVAREEGIEVFRGDPDDVLARLLAAAEAFDVDLVASCTADCPFVDPPHLDRLIDLMAERRADYVKIDGLPFGTFCYGLRRTALAEACALKATRETEVWGGYFTETERFRCETLAVAEARLRRPELRLTVDEAPDFEVVRRVIEALHRPGRVFGLDEIVAWLDAHPEVAALNAAVQQKPAPPIRLRAVAAQ